MPETAATCAAAEPRFTRILRLFGIALLTILSATLAASTLFVIEAPNVATFLRLAAFVAALGMLTGSVAAFWWQDAALRRVEWAAYLGIALLFAEQFITKPGLGPSHSVAGVFGLLIAAVVLARISRRQDVPACNCG